MKTVLITGASSDIGLEVSKIYLSNGWNVIGLYHSGRDELSALSGNIKTVQIDFSDKDAVSQFFEKYQADLKGCAAFVHCAALYEPCAYKDAGADDILKTITINALPSILFVQKLAPLMAENGFGRIVNLSSIGVKFGGGSNSYCYALSKHMLEFMPADFKAWASNNVYINTLRVGVTDTRIHERDGSKDMKGRVALIPAGRMATAQEIAETVYWYGSENNGFTTGQTIAVAGGE